MDPHEDRPIAYPTPSELAPPQPRDLLISARLMHQQAASYREQGYTEISAQYVLVTLDRIIRALELLDARTQKGGQ